MFALLLLVSVGVLFAGKNDAPKDTPRDRANDTTAILVFEEHSQLTEGLGRESPWTDERTCTFVGAYQKLSWVMHYAERRGKAFSVTPAAIRDVRMKFAEIMVVNLQDRSDHNTPVAKKSCVYEINEGGQSTEGEIFLSNTEEIQKFLEFVKKDNPELLKKPPE